MSNVTPAPQTVATLAQFYHRNGYVRRQNPNRRAAEKRKYKKGDEVRLTAQSPTELRAILFLLRVAGFEPGKPFRKGRFWRVPIYGREEVARFLKLIGEEPEAEEAAEAMKPVTGG